MKKVISLILVIVMLASLSLSCAFAGTGIGIFDIGDLVSEYGKGLDLSLVAEIISGYDRIKEKGIDLDPSVFADVIKALADAATEGVKFQPLTVRGLFDAIIQTFKEGMNLKGEDIFGVVGKLSGNETYGEIMLLFCKVTNHNPFWDISEVTCGYYDAIVEAYYMGLVSGYKDGTFRPYHEVTRAQFITMIWRAAGNPDEGSSVSFKDAGSIAKDYVKAVAWGVKHNVIKGFEDNTFRPNANISRAQMATFMYRYMKDVAGYDFGKVKPLTFTDKGLIANAYLEAVTAIVSAGIMNGVNAKEFSPNTTANRGMAATVILRAAKAAL